MSMDIIEDIPVFVTIRQRNLEFSSGIINMGVYGGTSGASKSYFGNRMFSRPDITQLDNIKLFMFVDHIKQTAWYCPTAYTPSPPTANHQSPIFQRTNFSQSYCSENSFFWRNKWSAPLCCTSCYESIPHVFSLS